MSSESHSAQRTGSQSALEFKPEEEAFAVARLSSRRANSVLGGLLVVGALLSVAAGLRNGFLIATDFKIDLARLLWSGGDPYSAGADYGHLAYLLLTPLAPLDDQFARLLWALVNLSAGVGAGLITARAFNLDAEMQVRLVLIFVASTPFRVAVGNAQVSLILLLAASLLLLPRTSMRAVASGVAYFKWTFAAPLGLFVLVRRGLRDFGLWIVPALVGFACYSVLTRSLSWEALLAPVLRRADNPNGLLEWLGHGDLMTVLGLWGVSDTWNLGISAGALVILSVVVARSFRTERLAVAAACALSLPLVFHLAYDYVFLLPAFAAGLERRREVAGRLLVGVCMIEFFADVPAKLLRIGGSFFPEAISSDEGLARFFAFLIDFGGWPVALPAATVHFVLLMSVLVLLAALDRSAVDPRPRSAVPVESN
jgi:hypothetical protein